LKEADHGTEFNYRMDRRNVEPGDRMHEDQPWL
jgi:hypothetical protein